MLIHVHNHQTRIDHIATSYGPIHPLLPLLGNFEPILRIKHLWLVVVQHRPELFAQLVT
jgi:hypothetical protein